MANNIETSLDWKKHDNFFIDLNKMLDMAAVLEIGIYEDIANIYPFYALISAIMSKHKGYIRDFDKKDKKMKEIRKAIYSDNIKREIVKKSKDLKFNKVITQIFDDLVNIYRDIVEALVDYELLPKVHKVDTSTPSAVRNLK